MYFDYEVAKAHADILEKTEEEKQAFIRGFLMGALYAVNNNKL